MTGVSKFGAAKAKASFVSDRAHEERIVRKTVEEAGFDVNAHWMDFEQEVAGAGLLGFFLLGAPGKAVAEWAYKLFSDQDELLDKSLYDYLPEGVSLRFFGNEFGDANESFLAEAESLSEEGTPGMGDLALDLTEAYAMHWAMNQALPADAQHGFFDSPLEGVTDWWGENEPLEAGAKWMRENIPEGSLAKAWRQRHFTPFQDLRLKSIIETTSEAAGSAVGIPYTDFNLRA